MGKSVGQDGEAEPFRESSVQVGRSMNTTQSQLLAIVGQRYPHLDVNRQTALAHAALRAMAEPQWARLRITPLMAVKLASHRSKRKIF